MSYPHSIVYGAQDWGRDRRTATDILGPPADPVDPNDPQQHGYDPDGPGQRAREDSA